MVARFVALCLLASACGGRSLPGPGPDEPVAAPAPAAAEPAAPPTQPRAPRAGAVVELMMDGPHLWIQITRETGDSKAVDLGVFGGACTAIADPSGEPEVPDDAVFGADCHDRALRFVPRNDQLIVLEGTIGEDGATGYDPKREIPLPVGVPIKYGLGR